MPIDIDILVEAGGWPPRAALRRLATRAVKAALAELGMAGESELSLVFTDDAHIRTLNAAWRRKDKPTNVLSFPASPPVKSGASASGSAPAPGPSPLRRGIKGGGTETARSARKGAVLPPLLGDIVLAAETVTREAGDEMKPFEHHLCHLIVHGLLHLLGHDHETDSEAEEMEGAERRILARLAIPDPYR